MTAKALCVRNFEFSHQKLFLECAISTTLIKTVRNSDSSFGIQQFSGHIYVIDELSKMSIRLGYAKSRQSWSSLGRARLG